MNVIKWRVWLDDGSVLDSDSTRWEDVPDRVIAVKAKIRRPDGSTYTQKLEQLSHYGRPDTLKAGADIPDEQFKAIMEQVDAFHFPPED